MSENAMLKAFSDAVTALRMAKDEIARKGFERMAREYSKALLDAEIDSIEAATKTSLSRAGKELARIKRLLRDEQVHILTDNRGSVILYRDAHDAPLAVPERKRDKNRIGKIQELAAYIAGCTPPMARVDIRYGAAEYSADDSSAHRAHQERMKLVQ
jgi:hypothetical protein